MKVTKQTGTKRLISPASSPSTTPTSSSNRYLLLAVKVLLILVILLLLPKLVEGKNRRQRRKTDVRRTIPRVNEYIKQKRHVCETDPEDLTCCGSLMPEESMNCIHQCLSQACYDEIYASMPLEDGEIDIVRAEQFEACLRDETKAIIREERARK